MHTTGGQLHIVLVLGVHIPAPIFLGVYLLYRNQTHLLHSFLVDFDGFVQVSLQQVNLPQHYVSQIVPVKMQGSVQLVLCLTRGTRQREPNHCHEKGVAKVKTGLLLH